MKRLLRLGCIVFASYWIGCFLMVAVTPRPQSYDCHGKTRQACLEEITQSRRAKDRSGWLHRRVEAVPPEGAEAA